MPVVDRVPLPAAGNIIILNGASSSGKTSICRSLQLQLPGPHHHLQLDAFREMEPPLYWADWEKRSPEAVARQVAALCRAMNAAIAQYSVHEQGVIFDMAFTNPESWRYALKDLAHLPVYLVGVTCAVEELSRRERARGNRDPGLAARQSEWIHAGKEYDFMVDSTSSSPEHGAAEIAAWLSHSPVPSAFRTMQIRLGVA